ncbi:PAS domain-containing sensor histidine kinase [Natrinema marinum]|uniref:sensor histidine kinase n=1 Tax=Natrinema marinum TaxID=2961598 RepID=UPI0020C8A3A5|nr:PAS domain-containing sensor histidine kinase [Natrinema marinum]
MKGDSDTALPEAFDDLDIGITLRDPKTGAILDANAQVGRLYGYSRAELLEMKIEDYTPPSTKFSQEKAVERIQAAAAGDSQEFEWQIERASGELIWIRVRLNSTTIDETPCVISEIRNITEYKSRERRLRLLNRVIRHNLRNETNLLIGYADRLKDAVEKQSLEDEAETISEIAAEIGTLSDSVHQIEEIAKPDATQRTPTNLGDLVRDVIEGIEAEYPDAALTVERRSDVRVNADEGLRYAIEHALDNAIVHDDRQVAAIEVVVTRHANTGQAEVKIIDGGPTIPDIEIDVLEEDVEGSTTYHGSGLGLWVMQWCVDSLGGELVFEENSPRGNVVRFLLPSVRPATAEERPDRSSSRAE